MAEGKEIEVKVTKTRKKREPNKKYILDKIKALSIDGMDFPMNNGVVHSVPTKKTVKNARAIIKACDDADLIGWDVSLYSNGSVLFYYYKRNGITAMVNVAEVGASGIFAFRGIYEPLIVDIDSIKNIDYLSTIIEIFKKVEHYEK